MDKNDTNLDAVDEWNSDLAKVLIPNDVILSLYITLGILGNSIVILVYSFRMKKKTEDRYFIPVLAIADLSGSTICGSFGIALNMMQAKFYNARLCKAWWFFAAFTTFMSILLLFIIAIQRYLKVCRPLGKQMSLFHKRLAIGLSVCLAIVLAVPTTELYGSVDFPNTDGSVTGRRCSKLKSVSKTATLAYGVTIVLILLTCIIIMIYVYTRIAYKLYNHFKYAVTFDPNGRPSCSEQLHSNSESHFENEKDTCTSEVTVSGIDSNTTSKEKANHEQEKTTHSTTTNFKAQTKSKKTNHEQQNKRIMHKLTIMFMLITIVFLICYIPKVILMVTEGLNPVFWEKFSDSERAAVLFVYRSYILNNVINPFIYAFMDLEFRKETNAFFMCSNT